MVRAHWESGNESEISERALRLAVAMERSDLADAAAALIVSRVFSETSGAEPIGEDSEGQSAYRTRMLVETASVFAQLQ